MSMQTQNEQGSMKQVSALRSFRMRTLLAAAVVLLGGQALATSYYWDCTSPIETSGFGTAGGTWGTDLRWSTSSAGTVTPGIQSPTTSDDLNFGYTTTGLATGTVTVTGIQNAKTLTFASGSGAIVLSNGTINLPATSTITVNNAADTISSIITGAATSLTKAGTGALTLSGANTYSGITTLSAGTLNINNASAIGTGAFTINGGTIDNTSGGAIVNANNNAQSWAANFTFTGTSDLDLGTGTVTNNVVNFRTIYVNGSTLTVGGPVINTVGSGNGGIMKYGAGTLKLTGGSGGTTNYAFFCYGGKTSIQGGTWWLNQTLNNNNLNVAGGATFEQTGGIVNSPLNPKISYYQTGSAGTSTGLFSGGTFNALGTFYVGLYNAAVMTVSGTAQLNLNGLQIGQQATFTSTVNLNGGTVACSSVYTGGTASDHTSVLNFNGGKLQAKANANPFISGLTANNVSTNGAVIDSQSFAIAIPQALIHDPALGATPDGGLTKLGTGTLTLSGTNTYTGVTTLAAGTLSINTLTNGGFNSSIGAASSASSNLVFSGGALSYTGPNASSDRGFTLAYGTNIITVTTAAAALTLTGGCPTNTVFLKKLGAGTLVLDPGAGSVYSLGSLSADDGTLTLKSGTITTTRTNPNVTAYVTGAGARTGKLVVDGATLTVANGYRMTVGATASGNLDILSGTVNVGWLILGHNGTVTSTQGGGSVNAAELFHYDAGTATHTMTGGVLTVRRIYNWTKTTGATFTLNLNGGTIVAAAGTANLIDHNSQTNLPALEVAVKLGSVGATIDTSLSSATNVLPMVDMPGQAGRLTKIGTGTLSLTATNTYSGATVVSNGVLRLTHAQVLAVTNEVRIATGAMINLDFNGTQTIRRLYINDELMTINRRYGPDNLPASLSGTTGYLFTTEGAPPKGTLISFL